MPQLLLHGAKLQCYINGKLAGQVTGFSWDSINNHKDTFCVDSLSAFDLVAGPTMVMGTIELLRLSGDGGAQSLGMVSQQSHISTERYFTLLLKSRDFGQPIFYSELCTCVSESWEVRNRSLMQGIVKFKAIIWTNEAQQT